MDAKDLRMQQLANLEAVRKKILADEMTQEGAHELAAGIAEGAMAAAGRPITRKELLGLHHACSMLAHEFGELLKAQENLS